MLNIFFIAIVQTNIVCVLELCSSILTKPKSIALTSHFPFFYFQPLAIEGQGFLYIIYIHNIAHSAMD